MIDIRHPGNNEAFARTSSGATQTDNELNLTGGRWKGVKSGRRELRVCLALCELWLVSKGQCQLVHALVL